MTKWILIIFIASDLWTAVAAFDSEEDCYAALEEWDITPPARATCLPGVIEKESINANSKRKRK